MVPLWFLLSLAHLMKDSNLAVLMFSSAHNILLAQPDTCREVLSSATAVMFSLVFVLA